MNVDRQEAGEGALAGEGLRVMNAESPEALEVRLTALEWDEAMVTNDADAIGAFMAEDWVLIGNDGSVVGKEPFLQLIRARQLSHDVMTSQELQIRVYGTTAVVIGTGASGGVLRGTRFFVVERSTSVFVKQDGRWRCVVTQLSGDMKGRDDASGVGDRGLHG